MVDRFGQTQVMIRDRFAGPHTPATAAGKGWTAVSFRTNTTDLVGISQPGMPQAGLRDLPGAVILGGGVRVEAAGVNMRCRHAADLAPRPFWGTRNAGRLEETRDRLAAQARLARWV